jgi:aspartyl-tRNA(Asn)/glutamyl-tRNA(Gln) amidotransferase subunit A
VDLTDLTLVEASALIAKRAISPVELTRSFLNRIAALEPVVNSYITVTADLAADRAKIAEIELGRGQHRGPLHGIPLALKDVLETRGIRTTAGSSFLAEYVPADNCVVVDRLDESGAIILGKHNMTEWALKVTDSSPRYGRVSNPWNADRLTGGSSSGSGAAVSARLCIGAFASDTGGSIRIPASYCGVVGLKPTFGRVSTRGVIPLSWHLDHVGPLGRRVADIASLLQAVARYDPEDPYSANVPIDDYRTHLADGVRGWRVALASGTFVNLADAPVRDAVQHAAQVFAELGATVEEVSLNPAREAWSMYATILTADAAAYQRERLAENPSGFLPDVLEALQRGAQHAATDYALARRTQVALHRKAEALFADYDLVLLPTTPSAAPLRDEPASPTGVRLPPTLFTAFANVVGIPALSVPCGFTDDGMPIGLQLLAGHFAEARVLQAGYAFEAATVWHQREPSLAEK